MDLLLLKKLPYFILILFHLLPPNQVNNLFSVPWPLNFSCEMLWQIHREMMSSTAYIVLLSSDFSKCSLQARDESSHLSNVPVPTENLSFSSREEIQLQLLLLGAFNIKCPRALLKFHQPKRDKVKRLRMAWPYTSWTFRKVLKRL